MIKEEMKTNLSPLRGPFIEFLHGTVDIFMGVTPKLLTRIVTVILLTEVVLDKIQRFLLGNFYYTVNRITFQVTLHSLFHWISRCCICSFSGSIALSDIGIGPAEGISYIPNTKPCYCQDLQVNSHSRGLG